MNHPLDYFVGLSLGKPFLALCVGALLCSPSTSAFAQEEIRGVGPVGKMFLVAEGLGFAEGPASDHKGNLYFTDFPNNRVHRLSPSGELTIVVENSGQANGLMINRSGELFACQMDGRLVAYSMDKPAKVRIVAAKYNGRAFNAPNDLVIDAAGGVYFTDPPLEKTPLRQDRIAVYYVTVDGHVSRLIDDLEFPNGVMLSPDEKTLYVVNSKSPQVMAYPVEGIGQIGEARVFCVLKQKSNANMTGGDGLTVDAKGNLYIASPLGIQVFDSTGTSLGAIAAPKQPYNVTFGGPSGRTLFIAAESSIYAAKMAVPGHIFQDDPLDRSHKESK